MVVIHTNDSRAALGSRVDRHAHIGRGTLGRAAFARLMQDADFSRVPKILETPKEMHGRKDWDEVSIALLEEAGERAVGGDTPVGMPLPPHGGRHRRYIALNRSATFASLKTLDSGWARNQVAVRRTTLRRPKILKTICK